jgi:hypothetical protein
VAFFLADRLPGVWSSLSMSRVNQDGKRDNQDGKFFEGSVFEPCGSDLTRLEAI